MNQAFIEKLFKGFKFEGQSWIIKSVQMTKDGKSYEAKKAISFISFISCGFEPGLTRYVAGRNEFACDFEDLPF